jgi:hypothetical protein
MRWCAGAAPTDVAVGGLLVAAATLFFQRWPHDLFPFDEGLFLYDALRVLRGEVIYRDFFEIITPGAIYVLAGSFGLFGATMATARAVNAVEHGLIVLVLFALCRRLGVRRELAAAAAVVHLVFASLALPFTSPHWLGTLLMLACLAVALGPPRAGRRLLLGVAVGLLIAVQQQKGLVIGAAAAALVCTDGLVGAAAGSTRPRALLAALGTYAAGVLVVVGPLFAALLIAAGPQPLYDALVRFPLESYRGYNRTPWGRTVSIPGTMIAVRSLIVLPAIALVTAVRAVSSARAGGDRPRTRALFVLALFAGAAVLSVAYYPDATHLGIIAPLPLLLAAETLEAALSRAGSARWPGWVVACGVGLACAAQLTSNLERARAAKPVSMDSAFGRVDTIADERALVETLRERLRARSSREVFGYPFYASIYLLAGADNPTRFQVLLPGYSPSAHFDETLSVLEARQVPYVAVLTIWVDWQNDRVVRYLQQHYRRVPLPGTEGRFSSFALFERLAPDQSRPVS